METYTERGYRTYTDEGHTWSGDTHRESIYTEKEHTRRGDKWSGDTHGKWGHTRKRDIGLTRRRVIHGKETHTEKEYRTYTEKGHTWSGDIHGEDIHGEGTNIE